MWRHRACASVVLVGAIAAACGTGEPATVDTATDPGGSATTATVGAEDGAIRAVFVDPDDPSHLLVSVDCIPVPSPGAPSPVEIDEGPDRVVLRLRAPVLDPPCNPVQVDARLQAPLGDRGVSTAAGAPLPVDTYVPLDPSRLVPAACSDEAARAVVANDVDGGLRSELIGCAEGWMAVRTSSDACPATGEAPAEGCIANVHTVYWRDVDGHWTITGFDDCDSIRRQYPGPPPALCDPDG